MKDNPRESSEADLPLSLKDFRQNSRSESSLHILCPCSITTNFAIIYHMYKYLV